ncbi:MAG TPA: M48 family metalloprotease [Thiolinea sp.]|nr:M48 family metalloprotease [Thiolinea sp.]
MFPMSRFPFSLLMLGVFALPLASPLQAELDLSIPDIGSLPAGSAATTLGQVNAQETGRQLVRKLRSIRPIIEDPELSQWLRRLGQRLAPPAGLSADKLLVLMENNSDINAYSMLGGVIVINSGLILSTDSESELAAVLAHEIAHVSQNHLERMRAENTMSPWVTGLGILAGAAAASQDSDAGQAILSGTLAYQAHQQIVFSQRAESEADRVGLRALAAAGFDPMGMPQFMEKLDRSQNNPYGELGKYLSSHPLSIDRLSDTRSRARQQGGARGRENPDYAFAREKLRQLVSPGSAAGAAPYPTLPGYVEGLKQLRRNNAAATLKLANASQPVALALLQAQALLDLQQQAQAQQLLNPWYQRNPQDEAVALLLAQSLVAAGQPDRAWQVISRVSLSESTSLEFLEGAQTIARQAGLSGEAMLYNAERSLRLGEYVHGKATLQQALKISTLSPQTRARTLVLLRSFQLAERNKGLLGR